MHINATRDSARSRAAGEHRFAAKLADTADGKLAYTAGRTIALPTGRVLVIDFDSESRAFAFVEHR